MEFPASNLHYFKRRLDKFLKEKFITSQLLFLASKRQHARPQMPISEKWQQLKALAIMSSLWAIRGHLVSYRENEGSWSILSSFNRVIGIKFHTKTKVSHVGL